MKSLLLSPTAKKDMEALSPKQAAVMAKAILSLLNEAMPPGAGVLHGTSFYRIYLGESRIVYDLTDNFVRVLAAGKMNANKVQRVTQQFKK